MPYVSPLDDFSDFENRLVLAVAADFMNALLGFITNRSNLIGLNIGCDHFGRDLALGNKRSANLDGVAVYQQ
jgi:hypothetical protein